MEEKAQKQIIEYFTFFDEYYGIVKTSLRDCQRYAVTINKLIARCKNVREACLTDTPLGAYPFIQSKISDKLYNLIAQEVQKIKVHLYNLEELFEKLNIKYKVFREDCDEIDLKGQTPLVRGSSVQPPLKELIEFAEDCLNFACQVYTQIEVTLNTLFLTQEEISLDNLKIGPHWQQPSEAQKNIMKKQKEALENKQKEEKNMIIRFRRKVEEKISSFIKENTKPYLQFEPMDQMYRSIIRDVAEAAGVQVFSFGQEGIDRYSVVYTKEKGPSEDELEVRRAGGLWNDEKAAEMSKRRLEIEKQTALETEEEKNRKRKRGKEELSGTFYKQKYAHLIGEDAAIEAAQKTNMNKSYGEVPSENKKDLRSIEQTMADIKAKKMKKTSELETNDQV
ncbi:Sperm-associated antigen 7 [Eumeta japonica]|uniref:Sperm-associated antigen 7 n=1 Tax=Eumeta variegata TaxID=151549 RepID=A0A4C1T5K9_EUMVA|nr:Sperm-associated antigen 7 [Eumeta japonica]